MLPDRRTVLKASATGVAASLLFTGTATSAAAAEAPTPEPVARDLRRTPPPAAGGPRLLARITPVGARITTVCIDTGTALLACRDLARSFALSLNVAGEETPLTIARAYTRATPSRGDAEGGTYVVFELAGLDEQLPQPYRFVQGNTEPQLFREYAADGTIVQTPRVQATSTPVALGDELVVTVTRTRAVVQADDAALTDDVWQLTGDSVHNLDLEGFDSGTVSGRGDGNALAYRLYRPQRGKGKGKGKGAPLVLFLHGSGQVGTDNLAHVLSSRGAVGVLEYEDAFVVAPQEPSVFDPFDTYDEATGNGGGIHWQTRNRRGLLAGLVRDVLRRERGIDPRRVYVVGLSRGAEGALALVLDEPKLFAGAVLASGREAGTVEWMAGHATPEMLRPARRTPLWFFHAVEDTVSPVAGSRINVEILRGLEHPDLRYTEVSFAQPGDSGYLASSAHNSWDLAFNSPDVWNWLLSRRG